MSAAVDLTPADPVSTSPTISEVIENARKAEPELLNDIRKAQLRGTREGRRFDLLSRGSWWFGLGLVWFGVIAGFLSGNAHVPGYLQLDQWAISLITAAGGGVEVLRRRSSWRLFSENAWALAVDAEILIAKHKRTNLEDSLAERVEATQYDFEAATNRYGDRRDAIINSRETLGRQLSELAHSPEDTSPPARNQRAQRIRCSCEVAKVAG